MKLKTEEKEQIKNFLLLKFGVEIDKIIEFDHYLLISPYGFIKKQEVLTHYDFNISLNVSLCEDLDEFSDITIEEKMDTLDLSYNNICHIKNVKINTDYLIIRNNSLVSIDFFQDMFPELSKLNLNFNKIKNMDPLIGSKNITHLYIQNNPIEDLSFVNELPYLEYLNIGYVLAKDISMIKNNNLKKIYTSYKQFDSQMLNLFSKQNPLCKIETYV